MDTAILTDEQAEDSSRKLTDWGHLRVDNCILTAESVDGYLGKELKSSDLPQEILARLDDNKIYNVYRPADELKKAIDSYNLVPLTDEHHFVSAQVANKSKWLGTIGSKAYMDDGKVRNDVSIWDPKEVIKQLGLKDDISKEDFKQNIRSHVTIEKPRKGLSGGYKYKLVDEAGLWNGKHYDFKMKDIVCNHVALVGKPRVQEAQLADSLINLEENEMTLIEKLRQMNPQIVADAEAEIKKEAEKDEDKEKKSKVEKAEDKKDCTKDAAYKQSTKSSELSTDSDDDEAEDKKIKDSKDKMKAKDSIPEGRIMTDSDIQEMVNTQVAAQLTKQLAEYNGARQICESAIGKTTFAVDASPEAMYTSTLNALSINCDGYSLETKQALLKEFGSRKVAAAKKPQTIMDSSRANDSFNVIEL